MPHVACSLKPLACLLQQGESFWALYRKLQHCWFGTLASSNCMMCLLQEGEPSWELFRKERDGLLESLKRRAKMLEHALNKLEGVHCTPVDGALYAFPTIHLPKGASEKAKELGKSPDWLYCKELLEATGIVVVPGSGFGQADGTLHFRTTILPAEDAIEGVCNSMQDFHGKFLKKYGSS